MKHRHTLVTTSLTTLALAAGGLVAGGLASPANAIEPGSLTLTGPTAVTIGAPAVMTATGHVPSDAYLPRYVYVYAIPTSVVASCPATHDSARQISYASSAQGGETTAFVGVEGDFSVPIAYTASQPGTFLLCGYLTELDVDDAMAQHVVTASGGTTNPPATSAPANTSRPKVVQRGSRLVCKRGTWTGASSYSYRWKVGRSFVRGATKPRLRVTRALRGKKVACSVKARNAAGARTVLSRPLRVR